MSVLNLTGPPGPEPRSAQKRPAVAWAASLVLPGAGQIYVGAVMRGIVSLVAVALAALALVSAEPGSGLWAIGLRTFLLMYAFASLDAYFTAREANQGLDPDLADNPRVAAALNLLTKGLGYFYLGERTKGVLLFVLLTCASGPINKAPAGLAMGLSLLLELLTFAMAADAYRIAARSVATDLRRLAVPETPVTPLPSWIPLGCSGVVVLSYLALVLVGVVAVMMGAV